MNISLTPQLENYVRAKVDDGLYHSSSEVVREALRLLQHEEAMKLKRLQSAIQEGLESGEAQPFDVNELIAELDAEKE